MHILFNPYKNIPGQTYSSAKRNMNVFPAPLLNDVFELREKPAFNGIDGLFKTGPCLVPQIEILPGVSDGFVSKATKQISEFPLKWLKSFRNNNYKIILSPSFSEAYKSQKVFSPEIEACERQNPKGTLGVTYSEGRFGKKFFVFCDKPPYSDLYIKEIVNHELSHGVVNVSGLDKDEKVLKLIKRDTEAIIKERKLDKITPAEREMISKKFFNPRAYLPLDEIIADTYAGNNGGGCYGSGLVMNVKNPGLMKNLFPNLSEYLKTI